MDGVQEFISVEIIFQIQRGLPSAAYGIGFSLFRILLKFRWKSFFQ